MKRRILTILLAFGISLNFFAQKQSYIVWKKVYGAGNAELGQCLQQTTDGGYIIGGSQMNTNQDCWLLKLDSDGNQVWEKTYSGNSVNSIFSVKQISGGYLIGGQVESTTGIGGGNKGRTDALLMRTDGTGNRITSATFGGSNQEFTRSAVQTADGSFVFAGTSASNDGQVNQNHDSRFGLRYDLWMVKVNSSLSAFDNRKVLGGAGHDIMVSMQPTTDGGYIVGLYTESRDGDITGFHGTGELSGIYDFWIVKLDAAFNIVYSKALGGFGKEEEPYVIQTSDGGYIVAGRSDSMDGDVSTNKGGFDYWVVKLNANLTIQWQKSLGGSNYDGAASIRQTTDGGYVVIGSTASNDQDLANSGFQGQQDVWVVKLSSQGAIERKQSFGGSGFDNGMDIQQTSDGNFVFIANATSSNGDVGTNRGGTDLWVVKFGFCPTNIVNKTIDTTVCNQSSYTSPSGKIVMIARTIQDTVRYTTGCDSAYLTISVKFFNKQTRPDTNVVACLAQPYTLIWSRRIIRTAGVHADTLRTTSGCDSLIRNVVVSNLPIQSRPDTNVIACLAQPYALAWSRRNINTAGVHADTLRSSQGCDSLTRNVVISNYTVQTRPDTSVFICQGNNYILPFSRKTVSATNNYRDTLRSFQGCDSLIRNISLWVTIPQRRADTSIFLCQGSSFGLPFSGRLVNANGTFGDTLRNSNGCDSLLRNFRLFITIPQVQSDLSVTICEGASFTLPYTRRVVTAANIYRDTLRNNRDCDSLYRNVLVSLIRLSTKPDTSIRICQGSTFLLPYSRKTVTNAGIYRDTLKNGLGCDTLTRNVVLTYYTPQYLPDTSVVICYGQNFRLPYTDSLVSTDGNYRDIRKYVGGCDSLIRIVRVSIYRPQNVIVRLSGCYGEPLVYNGKTYTFQNPFASQALAGQAAYGCDSLNQVIVDFNRAKGIDDDWEFPLNKPLDTIIAVTTNDIISGSYKVTLKTPLSIGTATVDSFGRFSLKIPVNPIPEATFAYQICPVGCPNKCTEAQVKLRFKRDSRTVSGSGGEPIIISPNGDGLNDALIFDGLDFFPNNNLTIINRWGQQVYFAKPYKNDWTGTNQSGAELPDGTYFYSLNLDLADYKVQWGSITIRR